MGRRKQTFANLHPLLRDKLAEYVRASRGRDRGTCHEDKTWLSQERSLEDYEHRLGIHPLLLEALIQERISEKNNCRVLDVGVGWGQALQDLVQKFGASLEPEGIALTRRKFSSLKNYRHHVGIIETLELEKKSYDIIFSVRGGFAYTLNSFAAIETVLNTLEVGGWAFLEDSKLLLTHEWFRDFLNGKGFEVEVTRFDEGRPVASKYFRKNEKDLDLTSFKDRYIEYLNEHQQTLLETGLDRVAKGEVLDDFFKEAYSEKNYFDLLK